MSAVNAVGAFFGSLRTYATWNPADKGAAITLSGGDLITTQTTSAGLVRATIGKSSGTAQWEVIPSTAANNFGVANASASLSQYCGANGNSWGLYGPDGKLYTNGSGGSALLVYGSGDVITMLLDMDAGTLKAKKNGGSVVTLVTGLTGTIYPAWGDATTVDSATTNFGATSLLYPEAGYEQGVYTS